MQQQLMKKWSHEFEREQGSGVHVRVCREEKKTESNKISNKKNAKNYVVTVYNGTKWAFSYQKLSVENKTKT